MTGRNQRLYLRLLSEGKAIIDKHLYSQTRLVMQSLVRNGHVRLVDGRYVLTEQGRTLAADIARRGG